MKIHTFWNQGEVELGYIRPIIESTRQYCDCVIFDRADTKNIIPPKFLNAALKIPHPKRRIMAVSDLMSFFTPLYICDDTWYFDVDFIWLRHPARFPWITDDLNYFRQSNNEIGANAVFYPKSMIDKWGDYIIPTLTRLLPQFGKNDLATCEYPLRSLPFGKVFKQAALFPLSMSDIFKYVRGRSTLSYTVGKVLKKQSFGVHLWHGQFYRASPNVAHAQQRFNELFNAVLTIRSHYERSTSKYDT